MGWKNYDYWLKGGIIGIMAGLLILIFNQSVGILAFPYIWLIMFVYLIIFMCPIEGVSGNSMCSSKEGVWIAGFIFILISFGIGSLIGWIIGKIKKK